jgi:hypothetical protein
MPSVGIESLMMHVTMNRQKNPSRTMSKGRSTSRRFAVSPTPGRVARLELAGSEVFVAFVTSEA